VVNRPSTLFNGLVASQFLRQDRMIRRVVFETFPVLSQNDITILFFLFELVWKKQYELWILKHNDLSVLSLDNFNPVDRIGYSIRQISLHTGIPRSTVSRLLSTLVDLGIVTVVGNSIYIIRNNDGISVLIERCNHLAQLFNEYEQKIVRIFGDD
jgi:DNA-binding transcriptional ArsR family regulator